MKNSCVTTKRRNKTMNVLVVKSTQSDNTMTGCQKKKKRLISLVKPQENVLFNDVLSKKNLSK